MGQLPREVRLQILCFYFMQFTFEQIGLALGIDPRTAENWIIRFNETGDIEPRRRSGRPRITTRDQDVDLVGYIKLNPFKSATDARNDSGLEISVETVRRRLKENGLNAHIAARAEFLTNLHKNNRTLFAEQWLNNGGWENPIFTDEVTFLTGSPHLATVWREVGTRYNEENLQIVKNSGRASIAVWACITRDGLGPIFYIYGHFDSYKYLDILELLVLPWIREKYPQNNYRFIQDRSPIHTSTIVKQWFEDNMPEQNVYLPPKSPDMNVIEHAWAVLKKRLSQRNF